MMALAASLLKFMLFIFFFHVPFDFLDAFSHFFSISKAAGNKNTQIRTT